VQDSKVDKQITNHIIQHKGIISTRLHTYIKH